MQENTIKDVKLKLYREVAELCRKEEIRFFLMGDSALSVYRNGEISERCAVAIDAKNIYKFIRAVESVNNDKRAIDGMIVNGKYPIYELRYVDLDTVDFSLNKYQNFMHNCLGLQIKIISNVPSKASTKNRVKKIYNLYKLSNEEFFWKLPPKERLQGRCFKIARAILGKNRSANYIFRYMIKKYRPSSAKVVIGAKSYPSKLLKKTKKVDLGGDVQGIIPDNADAFFKKQFGEDWENYTIKKPIHNNNRFISTECSWHEFEDFLVDHGLENYQKSKNKHKKIHGRYLKYHKKVLKYYDLLNRTNDRFLLWSQYMPQKDSIKRLYEEKDFESLKKLLATYLDALNRNYELGLGLCFDKEIFDITMELLKNKGQENYAKELRMLVPDVHWDEIHIYDYKGNLIK